MDDTESEELVSRLFALLTSMLEQGAAEAVQGQGWNRDAKFLQKLANHLQTMGEEIATVAEAASALVDTRIRCSKGG